MKKKIWLIGVIIVLILLVLLPPAISLLIHEYRHTVCMKTIESFSWVISEGRIEDVNSLVDSVVVVYDGKKYDQNHLISNLSHSHGLLRGMYIGGGFSGDYERQTGVIAWTELGELHFLVKFTQEGKIKEIAPDMNDDAFRELFVGYTGK